MTNSDFGGADRARSWEPMGGGDLARLRLLAEAATRVEGKALARLDTVGVDDLGELVVWAWVLDVDRTHVLMVDHHRSPDDDVRCRVRVPRGPQHVIVPRGWPAGLLVAARRAARASQPVSVGVDGRAPR